MKKCTIIGKTNVGKTMFFINFADYLGLKSFIVELTSYKGEKEIQKLQYNNAKSLLIDPKCHKTLNIQSMNVNLPLGKGKKKIRIIDTVGLVDNIHPDKNIRLAISQTLATIRKSDVILHIIDAYAAIKMDLPSAMGEVDYQIAQFAQLKRGYAILANKMDLPNSEKGLQKIKREFQGNIIIPISALYKRGFKEVKTFVVNNV